MGQVSHRKWLRGRARVKAKAARCDDGAMPVCPIPGCGRPTQAKEGRGLSQFHCRYHVQFKNRHGSFWKATYRASELQPYRRAAERLVRVCHDDKEILAAVQRLAALLRWAGPVEHMSDVMTMAPKAKAKAALARMRRAEVRPERLLSIYLTIRAALAEDPVGPGGEPGEYRRVQVAKAAHRLASGYHADYGNGARYDRYPRSSGLALRHLGRFIEAACEVVGEACLDAVLTLKVAAAGPRVPVPPPVFPRSRRVGQGVARG